MYTKYFQNIHNKFAKYSQNICKILTKYLQNINKLLTNICKTFAQSTLATMQCNALYSYRVCVSILQNAYFVSGPSVWPICLVTGHITIAFM